MSLAATFASVHMDLQLPGVIDSGLVCAQRIFHSSHPQGHEGYRESRRCSRDTYLESYITKYTLVYEEYTCGAQLASAEKAHFALPHVLISPRQSCCLTELAVSGFGFRI